MTPLAAALTQNVEALAGRGLSERVNQYGGSISSLSLLTNERRENLE